MKEVSKDDRQANPCPEDLLRELMTLAGEDPGEPPSLEQLQKEARAYGKRRADQAGGRDNLIYRAGYALDAIGGLGANSQQLAGVLSSADLVREILESLGPEEFGVSLVLLIIIALNRPEIAAWAEAEGKWFEWQRLYNLCIEETAAFKASAAFAREGWRKKRPTPAQRYRMAEITRICGVECSEVTTRGEAFDFIDQAGGNPKFWTAPSRLPRPRYL